MPGSADDAVINSGSVQVTGSDANARSLTFDTGPSASGTLNIVDHTLTVSASGTSTLSGFLAVGGTLTLNDPTTFTGSVNSGGINVGGTLNIGSTFTITGADSTTNGNINDTNPGTAVVHVLASGSIIRNTSSGTDTIGPRVDNDGSVSVQTGTLRLLEGDAGSTTGSYAVSAGATLLVLANGGQNTFESPSITGAGTVEISGTTMTVGVGDTFTVPTLDIAGFATLTLNKNLSIPNVIGTGAGGGTRNGTGTLTITGTADLSNMRLDTGTTTVAASAGGLAITQFLTVGSTFSGTNSTLNLDVPTTYTASGNSNGINLGGGILNIASTFTMSGAGIQAGINNTGGSPVVNVLSGGSLIRDTSNGTAAIGPPVDNDGTVSVQTGTLDLTGGGLTEAGGLTDVLASSELDGPVTLNGGTLRGAGTLSGPVTNSGGTVAPGESPGTLTVTSDFTQDAGGTLAEELTGTTQGSQFDHLIVGGALTLGGTLAIQSSSFTPALSDTFKIISGAASRTGMFAQLTGATVNGRTYVPQYDADGATLVVNSAPPPPGVPVNTGPPVISGNPTPDNTLSCSTGSWTNNPTSFTYQWNRDGTPIAGATGPTYRVQIADEARTLTCTVTATGAGGASAPNTSAGVLVAMKGTLTCPKPTGRVSGVKLGPLSLGMTRAAARHKLHRFAVTHNKLDNFCLFGGWGIRVGYPTSHLLRSLSRHERARVAGKIVLALTANPFYALSGVRPGMRLSSVAARLKVGKAFHIGLNLWYVTGGAAASGVLKVRAGVIQEIGIADKRLTHGRKAQARFLTSFG